jgi:uncharacterized protein (TIGR02266 family)
VLIPAEGVRPGEEIWLRLKVTGEGEFAAQAKVLEVNGHLARCTLSPRADFRELIARYALQRRAGRTEPIIDSEKRRQHPRFSTLLKARFRSYQHLVSEYVTNISEGGMFIRTNVPPPLGSKIMVEVTLPAGDVHEVPAEVVWRVGPEQKSDALQPGIGVRFADSTRFHSALESLLNDYLARKPRVLLVDDDPFFLRVLADVLMARSIEVATASSGQKALHLLADLLYELDLVVLDLNMPKIDGHALMERLRRLGHEMDVKIAIVSAASEMGLAMLVGPEKADLAVSKSLGVDEVADRLLAALRRV